MNVKHSVKAQIYHNERQYIMLLTLVLEFFSSVLHDAMVYEVQILRYKNLTSHSNSTRSTFEKNPRVSFITDYITKLTRIT